MPIDYDIDNITFCPIIERICQCFYRYIATGKSRSYVGEAAYHYDENLQLYLADVIISAKCRRQGYGCAGLELLCDAAREAEIPELYDNIAIDNPGINLFLQCGFHEEYRTEEIIMLKKSLEKRLRTEDSAFTCCRRTL